MESLSVRKLLILAAVLLLLAAGSSRADKTDAVPSRRFEFTYEATIPAPVPGAQTIRLWIPVPQSDKYQDVRNLRIVSPLPFSVEKNAEYGNKLLYMNFPAAKAATGGEVRLTFDVTRYEHRVALGFGPTSERPPRKIHPSSSASFSPTVWFPRTVSLPSGPRHL
jgi:hypothetical protein